MREFRLSSIAMTCCARLQFAARHPESCALGVMAAGWGQLPPISQHSLHRYCYNRLRDQGKKKPPNA